MIEKVRSGNWKPDENSSDKDEKAALAARGYWQAFQEVKKSLRTILGGANAGVVVEKDHRIWYQEMFAPSVMAGIIKASDIVGYRWTIVQKDIREKYMAALERAGIQEEISDFATLLSFAFSRRLCAAYARKGHQKRSQ